MIRPNAAKLWAWGQPLFRGPFTRICTLALTLMTTLRTSFSNLLFLVHMYLVELYSCAGGITASNLCLGSIEYHARPEILFLCLLVYLLHSADFRWGFLGRDI